MVALFVAICTSCDNQSARYPTLGANKDSGDYRIDPYILLSQLDAGNTDAFLPMTATQVSKDELLPTGTFAWAQTDYLKIANALSEYVWNDQMEGWSVYFVNFDRDCLNSVDGFDSFIAIYYKEVPFESGSKYLTRQIDISPLARQVSWGSGSEYPHPIWGSWPAVDIENFEITADEALQIAETNGGQAVRKKVKDECYILVNSGPRTNAKWNVNYTVHGLFGVMVDPYTGKFKISSDFQ